MDGWAQSAQAHGIPAIYDIGHYPDYADGGAGLCHLLNQTAVSGFATALAKRYNSSGVQQGCTATSPQCHGAIQYYEEANEVNGWTCGGGSGTEETWPEIALQASWVYQAIKAVDPKAVVGAPNMAGGTYAPAGTADHISTPDFTVWLANYLDAGGWQYADAVGFHAYGIDYQSIQGRSSINTSALGCDSTTDEIGCAGNGLLNSYNLTRAVMDRYGLKGKPILISEGGWGPDLEFDCAFPINLTGCLTLADQDNYAARWVILLASTWSDGLGVLAQWYGYDLNVGTLDGTVQGDAGQSTDATAAWNQAAAWVTGATFPHQCAEATGSTVFVCDLTLAKGNQAQIIFNDDAGASAKYTLPTWVTQATPLLDAGLAAAGGAVITVGNAPVLLE